MIVPGLDRKYVQIHFSRVQVCSAGVRSDGVLHLGGYYHGPQCHCSVLLLRLVVTIPSH